MSLALLLLFLLSPVWVALLLPLTLAVAADGQKGGDGHCSPVPCGDVNISFPFGVVPEVECGLVGFQVACNNNTPYLGSYMGIFSLQILNIFYGNSSLIIADDHDFSVSGGGGCHVPMYNSSSKLGYPFSISPASKSLIFYNCTKAPAMAERGKLVETICHNNNTFVRVAEHYEESGSYGDYFLEGCNAAVVPVLGGSGETNASRYQELINDGFLLTWELPSVPPQPPPKPSKRKKHSIKIILIASLSAATSLILISIVWIMNRQKEKQNLIIQKYTGNESNIEEILKGHDSLTLKRYRYSELRKITGSFKEKLGEGGYGTVFKGNLEDGRRVAVKILKGSKGNGEEFLNEVVSIRRTSHVNVVNLLGFCLKGSKRALIYEYMANGSLDKYIYSEESKMAIGWDKLKHIAIGIARGLEYLHRGCNTRIIHFDIKPHNVLLDEEFCPKIADFGLAKMYHLKDSALSVAEARGTIGFIAPEVFSRGFGVVSTKSDVYSYGMMLLEMVGGRTNVKENTENSSEAYFTNWIYNRLVKDLQNHEVTCEIEEIARQMTLIGLWCIQTSPVSRPSTSRVIEMLENNIIELEMPPKPFLSCPSQQQCFSSYN